MSGFRANHKLLPTSLDKQITVKQITCSITVCLLESKKENNLNNNSIRNNQNTYIIGLQLGLRSSFSHNLCHVR